MIKRYVLDACDDHGCHCDVVESTDGDMVDYDDHASIVAELEARCAALAAENAALNNKMDKLATWTGIEFYSSAWAFNNNDGDAALEFMCDTETPATDAFLAEVRASTKADGVQEYADSLRHAASKHRELYGESIRVKALLHEAWKDDEFAEQLRQEAK